MKLVNDEWSKMSSYSVLIGDPSNLEPGYLEKIIKKDMVQHKANGDRPSDIVNNPKTAESLIQWYYPWCKRPCFTDDYLQTLNKPNATLVDIRGEGIIAMTEKDIMASQIEHELDVIMFCTGYRLATAVDHGKIIVTLAGHPRRKHSVLGGQEGSVTKPLHPRVPSVRNRTDGEDEDVWVAEVMSRARGLARGKLCNPSYMNAEGLFDQLKPEKALQAARASIWGTGVKDFVGTLEKWREGIVDILWVSWKMMN
ncbi:FAD/NAD(P)-binding domain-containing protein, partial [Penicillium frequentans]